MNTRAVIDAAYTGVEAYWLGETLDGGTLRAMTPVCREIGIELYRAFKGCQKEVLQDICSTVMEMNFQDMSSVTQPTLNTARIIPSGFRSHIDMSISRYLKTDISRKVLIMGIICLMAYCSYKWNYGIPTTQTVAQALASANQRGDIEKLKRKPEAKADGNPRATKILRLDGDC